MPEVAGKCWKMQESSAQSLMAAGGQFQFNDTVF